METQTTTDHEGAHSQLCPIRHLSRVQPIEKSLLRLVFAKEKVSQVFGLFAAAAAAKVARRIFFVSLVS